MKKLLLIILATTAIISIKKASCMNNHNKKESKHNKHLYTLEYMKFIKNISQKNHQPEYFNNAMKNLPKELSSKKNR